MKRLFFILILLSQYALAGGPLYVAGKGTFQDGLAGTPITWLNGKVEYYTDQGDLSLLLPNQLADQFVADAFSRWTSIPTAALTAVRAGTLNENVDGTNFYLVNDTFTKPSDLDPASGKPLAIVYDADGSVIDALMGAGSAEMCSTSSIYTQIDQINADGHFGHALIVINGNCAKTESEISILRYRLVRAFGRVLGLDYAQLNDSVIWGTPPPMFDDYAGFPVMHAVGSLCNESGCRGDADRPRSDDRAALSRLYPVTEQNASDFSGKKVFAQTTARITGNVRFSPWRGIPGQGMQGVNVIGRLVDPMTNRVSRQYSVASVSGFLFRGNAGNMISANTKLLDRFGSDNPELEGFFDLAGIEIPEGFNEAYFELSVEPVDSLYVDSASVGPYKKAQVMPSGSFTPVRVQVRRGEHVTRDIVMQDSDTEPEDDLEPNTFASSVPLPVGGTWFGTISGYGDMDFVHFPCRGNRTLSFNTVALDSNGAPTTSKLQPVLGAWREGDAENNESAWAHTSLNGTTHLELIVPWDAECKLGIADLRGDGRPDFRYGAHVFYAHDIVPERAPVTGGALIHLTGIGFTAGTQVFVETKQVPASIQGPDSIVFTTPAFPDGYYSVYVSDPATGETAKMDSVLRIGAANTRLVLVSGSNPQVPVGTQAPNPIRVRVIDAHDGTPVMGATVLFTAPSSAAIVGCTSNPCAFVTDQSGGVDAYIQVKAAGPSVINFSMPRASALQTTVNGVASALEISLPRPVINVSSGASASLRVSAVVVENGLPSQGRTVNFLLNSGSATFTYPSVVTDASGTASTTILVSQIASDANISACVAPSNAPCRTLLIRPVLPSNMVVQRVSGDQQTVGVGGTFNPAVVRVVDAAGLPVIGAPVFFRSDVYRAQTRQQQIVRGDLVITVKEQPVVLASSSSTVVTDAEGIARTQVTGDPYQPVDILMRAIAGVSGIDLSMHTIWIDSMPPPVISAAVSEAQSIASVPTAAASPRSLSPRSLAVTTASRNSTSSSPAVANRVRIERAPSSGNDFAIKLTDSQGQPVAGASVSFFVDVYSPAKETNESELSDSFSFHTQSDSSGLAEMKFDAQDERRSRLVVRAIAADAELTFTQESRRAQRQKAVASGAVPSPATSSNANPPTRSQSCTKADCSEASEPSALRQGSTASSTAPSTAEGK